MGVCGGGGGGMSFCRSMFDFSDSVLSLRAVVCVPTVKNNIP